MDHKSLFNTKEEYIAFRTKFKQLATKKEFDNGSFYLLLNLIRGHHMDRGFTPITNTNKLNSGLKAHRALKGAYFTLASGIPDYLDIPDQTKEKLMTILKDRQVYDYANAL